jgi:hypothetical protein
VDNNSGVKPLFGCPIMSFEKEVEKEVNPRQKFPIYCTNFDGIRATILAPTRRFNYEQVPFVKVLPGPFVSINVPTYDEIKKNLESLWPLIHKTMGLGNPSEVMHLKELLVNYDLNIDREQ